VWRLRVGDWRVGYTVDDAVNEVVVVRIGHRSEFYS
jgi:mRNA-degrading endonuclease RelE of RelBE toxin-antitoxin system